MYIVFWPVSLSVLYFVNSVLVFKKLLLQITSMFEKGFIGMFNFKFKHSDLWEKKK